MKKLLSLAALVVSVLPLYAESTRIKPMVPGDSNADLVYTPLPLCRVIDTRLAGGILTTTPRAFYVAGNTHDFTTQGGASGGCGIPDGATAVLINFVAVNPTGGGNLRGSAWPDPVPAVGSIINYQLTTPALNVANGIPFPICDPAEGPACDFDIYLRVNGASTHVVADVAGYFSRLPIEQIAITGFTAGEGLLGGGTSGDVTLSVNFGNDGAATTAARSDHSHYRRTVIVQPGVDAAASGTALLAALASITGQSANNPYLLKIEPGIYDLGATPLLMKSHVDVEGSGEGATILRGRPFTEIFTNYRGVVVAADNTELRFLTVEVSEGGNLAAVAYFVGAGTSGRASHCTFRGASGTGENYGVMLFNAAPTTLESITASGQGGNSSAHGIFNYGAGDMTVRHSRASATNANFRNAGITIDAVSTAGTISLFDVYAEASGGVNSRTTGIENYGGILTMTQSVADAVSGMETYGLATNGIFGPVPKIPLKIDRSRMNGATNSVTSGGGYDIFVGASQLAGGATLVGSSTILCVGSYDEVNASPGFLLCP